MKGELEKALTEINAQLYEVVAEAKRRGIDPHKLRTTDGSWTMIPLIVAKAQLLVALASLKEGL